MGTPNHLHWQFEQAKALRRRQQRERLERRATAALWFVFGTMSGAVASVVWVLR